MGLTNLFLFSLGLAALAVPLWVHLRLGRVKQRAVVSTLRLMRTTSQTSRSPRRLIDVPLFLLRALILLLLALGFGRLLVPGLRGDGAQEYAVFILDVSGSMRAEHGRVWEQARRAALDAIGQLGRASRVAVVLSPSPAGNVAAWETPAQAAARVRALSPGYGANRLATAIRAADDLLAAMPQDRPKVLHLVSDCQRSAFADIDHAVVPADVELRVSKVGEERLSNRGVAVSVVAAGVTDLGIYGFGDGGGGTLRLDENGQTRPLAIAAGQDAARLSHAGKKDEWVTRKLTLDDQDALPEDNVAYDVYQAQDEIPVWLWEPAGELPAAASGSRIDPNVPPRNRRPAGADPVPRYAYEQPSYYLGRALQPAAAGDAASVSRYRPLLLTERGLDIALGRVGMQDAPRLLLLPAGKAVPAALVELVKKLTAAGGSVIFFGGPALDPGTYQAKFGAFTGVALGASAEYKDSPALAEITEGNPLWGGLDPRSRGQLTQAPLRIRAALRATEGTRVLAAYADGVPFVVEHPAGRGRVYFVNTSADRAWGDWPASAPLFVPALHLLAARALGQDSVVPAHEPALAGEPVTVRLAPEWAGRSLRLGGASWPVGPDGCVPGVVFDRPGVTDLVLTDGTRVGQIAVNFPPAESVLDCEPQAVVRQRLEALRRRGGGSSVRWEGEARGGLAWRLCLLASALLLVVEPVVANGRAKL